MSIKDTIQYNTTLFLFLFFLLKIPLVGHLHSDWSFEVQSLKLKSGLQFSAPLRLQKVQKGMGGKVPLTL